MAEDNATTPQSTNQNNDNQGIQGDNLNDLLSLLGGAGGAAIGAKTLGGMGASKGILLAPGAFKALGGAKSMHPAVAETQMWRGPLTDPAAIAEQRDLDSYVLNNLKKFQNPMNKGDIDTIHKHYGWGFGPHSGLGREILDNKMTLTPDKSMGEDWAPDWFKPGTTLLNINHPEGNIQSLLKLDPSSVVGFADTTKPRSPAQNLYQPAEDINYLTLDSRLMNPSPEDADLLRKEFPSMGSNYPWERSPNQIVAHEAQHAAQPRQDIIQRLMMELKKGNVYHNELPFEWEARATEHSALYPQTYNIPFSTRSRPEFYFHDNFKRNFLGK